MTQTPITLTGLEEIVRQHFYPGPVAGSTERLCKALNDEIAQALTGAGEAMTDAQRYACHLFEEEVGEVLQLLGKAGRFGLDTPGVKDPLTGLVNMELTPRIALEKELGDVLASIEYATLAGLVNYGAILENARRKIDKLTDANAKDNLGKRLAPEVATTQPAAHSCATKYHDTGAGEPVGYGVRLSNGWFFSEFKEDADNMGGEWCLRTQPIYTSAQTLIPDPAPSREAVAEPVAWQYRVKPKGSDTWSAWEPGQAKGRVNCSVFDFEERPLFTFSQKPRHEGASKEQWAQIVYKAWFDVEDGSPGADHINSLCVAEAILELTTPNPDTVTVRRELIEEAISGLKAFGGELTGDTQDRLSQALQVKL